ncbi:MAG: catechol-2,3-dioxygenase [Polaribacter sp.]|jgi:catechol-2,3-dioxygenase
MHFKSLKIFTTNLPPMEEFYGNILGLNLKKKQQLPFLSK